MNYIFLIIGFLLLIKGADLFVDGASGIAKKLGVPAVIIGLTIVSLGTSAPELAVSISASLKGSNDITMGNVLGSNLFNLLAALGCTAIVAPLVIKKHIIKNDFIVNLIATFILYVFTFTGLIGSKNSLSRIDGAVLVLMCITYIIYLIYTVKRSNKKEDEVALTAEFEDFEEQNIKSPNSTVKNIILSIVGVIGIILGGKIVVDSASAIALGLGLSEKLVGLTIVAIGTSLPELVTSLVAAKKGENDIALGNILGSNTFNILLILGLSSVISPITIAASLSIDLIFLIIVTLIIGALIFLNKKKEKDVAKDYAEKLKTKTASVETPVVTLSGGNQQKVVIAKWLIKDCDILIFDEPTRGIDVGAKSEIYTLMNELVAQGKSIIMISSELTEILRMSDRIIVMNEGRKTGELPIEEATQESIMNAATLRNQF